MTVSAIPTIEFNRDKLLTLAWQLTGAVSAGEAPAPEQLQQAADFLNLELDSLQLEGFQLRAVDTTLLALVAGQQTYTLPSDTFDLQVSQNNVIGTIVPVAGGNETLVTAMSRSEWMDLSTKTLANSAYPSRCFVERKATVSVTIWPVPSVSGGYFRYSKVRFLASAGDGGNTQDVPRPWQEYLTFAVAAKLIWAASLPLERVQGLKGEAMVLKEKCLAADKDHAQAHIHINHRYSYR
jgi:hypothetical protein